MNFQFQIFTIFRQSTRLLHMMNKQHQINQQDLFRLVKKIRENQVYQVFSLKRILKPKQARKGFRPIALVRIFWEFFWNLFGIF